MGKYYVAGIPFDSENSLKHYGVKGQEWGKHKFGIDADDRYIKWLKNAGQNIGKFTTNVAQNVAKGATTAARTVGSAVNKGANFVGGAANQAGKAIGTAANNATKWAGQQAQNAGKAIGTAANNAGNWAGQQAQNVGKTASGAFNDARNWVNQAGDNVRNGNVQKAVSDTAQNVGNFLTGNQARQDLENAQNSFILGRQGRVNAAQDAYNQTLPGMVENAANNAKNWAGQAAQDVGNAVSGAVKNAGDWAGDRARDVGGAVSGAAQNVGNFLTGNQARQDLENAQNSFILGRQGRVNAAQDAYNQTLPGMIENATNYAKNWVNQAGDNVRNGNVGKAVSGAVNDARNWVNQAGDNVRNGNVQKAVSGAAQNVGNFLTGNQARQDLENAQNSFILGRQGRVNAAQDAYNQTLPGMVENAAKNVGNAAKGAINSAGQWVNNATGNVGKTAQNAGNTAKGFINSAGQWVSNAAGNVGKAAQNVGNAVSGAANDAKNWAGQTAQNVGNAVGGAANAVGDFFSNRDEYQRLSDLSKHYNQDTGEWDSEENRQAFYRAQNDYNSHPLTAIPSMAEQIGSNIANSPVGDFARDIGETARQIGSNVGNYVDYNITGAGQRRMADMLMQNPDQVNTIMQISESGGWEPVDQYTNAEAAERELSDAKNNTLFGRVGQAAQNVGNWAGQAAKDVGGAVSGAAKNVGGAVSNAANAAGDWVSQTWDNVSGKTGRQNTHDNNMREIANDYNDPSYTSKQREEMLRYMITAEEAAQSHGLSSDYFGGNVGSTIKNNLDMIDYIKGNMSGYSPSEQQKLADMIEDLRRQNDAYANAMFGSRFAHSALNDKPDGVSDAFWEKYTADGGTREDYERDWR